jgi:hypothetical protein
MWNDCTLRVLDEDRSWITGYPEVILFGADSRIDNQKRERAGRLITPVIQ